MIITELIGGLGNQMFQYALGRVISLRNNDELKLDISSLVNNTEINTPRQYELDVFKVPAELASKQERKSLGLPNPVTLTLNRYLHTQLNPYPKSLITEGAHRYHPEIFDHAGDIYLSGYWQTEKYYKGYEKIVRQDFARRARPISAKNRLLRHQIEGCNSVSIHVRRGDYVTNPAANAFHGTCDLSYYRRAMKYVERYVKNPTYFVFSDDSEWAAKNIVNSHKTVYISHNTGHDAHEDIRLMANCKQNIIANSSFSWWGAWLNNNPDKIVIAPKQWFRDKKTSTKDLIPITWVRT